MTKDYNKVEIGRCNVHSLNFFLSHNYLYLFSCLLHKEGPFHLPLPKQFFISHNDHSEPCSSTCYKHQREEFKRSLSPPLHTDESVDQIENYNKRQRKLSNKIIITSNENDTNDDHCYHFDFHSYETRQKYYPHCLSRIENRMMHSSIQQLPSENTWILNDQNLFRLFYFTLDGDLCLLSQLFESNRTCQDLYQQFISDSKYFSKRISLTKGLPFLIRPPYRNRMPEGTTRAFLNYMKKKLNRTHSHINRKSTTTLKPSYQPCLHDGPCVPENILCHCIRMGTFCEKFCNCSIDCPHRFPGCACKGSCLFNNCLCSAEGRECDPDLCHNCGASLFFNPIHQFIPSIKS